MRSIRTFTQLPYCCQGRCLTADACVKLLLRLRMVMRLTHACAENAAGVKAALDESLGLARI